MRSVNGLIKAIQEMCSMSRGTDSVSVQRHTLRRKPFVGAYIALLLFMVIYFARPEDWIPVCRMCLWQKLPLSWHCSLWSFPFGIYRQRYASGGSFPDFIDCTVVSFAALSPVWRGGAFQKTLKFAKVLMVVLIITATVTTLQRLRMLIFTQAISVSAIAAVTIWKGHLIVGRLEGIFGGQYADPNDLALAIVISLPCAWRYVPEQE